MPQGDSPSRGLHFDSLLFIYQLKEHHNICGLCNASGMEEFNILIFAESGRKIRRQKKPFKMFDKKD